MFIQEACYHIHFNSAEEKVYVIYKVLICAVYRGGISGSYLVIPVLLWLF